MKDYSKILSITIPTYNRANYLAETLDSFIPEVSPYNIPIYISNNASIDNTVEVVKKYRKMYPNIHIQTNSENIGFDRNLIESVKMSNTEYCWLFSDDDTVLAGVVDVILKKIEEGNKLIVVNGDTYDLRLQAKYSRGAWQPSLEDKNYLNDQHEALIEDIGFYSTFVGSMVINKCLWDNVDGCKYINTGFLFMGKIYEYIVGYPAAYIGFPYIKIRSENGSWYKKKFQILNIELPKTLRYLENYNNSVKQKIGNVNQQYSFKDLLKYNAEGQFTMAQVEMIKQMKTVISKIEMIKFWIMAHIPPACSRFIIRIIDPKIYRRIQKDRILALKGSGNQFI